MNRSFKHTAFIATVLGVLGIAAGGCLDRNVVSNNPSVNTIVSKTVTNQSIDKVDLLFMIDNSVSMGDKQSLLALAVPNMLQRLVEPNCLTSTGTIMGTDVNGCPSGTTPEFAPVHNMHIGILSSSLGSRGGDVCPDSTMNPANMALNAHDNDNGELINRTGVQGNPTVENTIGDAPSPQNFLSYYPSVAANMPPVMQPTPAIMSATQLVTDFTSMIEGVHEHGCGFEAQNEAWYRFLIQPDPFANINVNTNVASFSGIDDTILQQRADFLRPDSLVAVIVVTDENEEADDPLTIRGQGWAFNQGSFPGSQSGGGAPEGTIQCQALNPASPTMTGPNDPNCQSCAFLSPSSPNFATDCPQNGTAGNMGFLDPINDSPNLRFFHQKERFGLFAGYPTSRYVRGLQKTTVPSVGLAITGGTCKTNSDCSGMTPVCEADGNCHEGDHEHDGNGNYIGYEDGQANCVNPLYASNLPTSSSGTNLCNLTQGTRTPDLVYYAAIAGVPHELLQATPGGTGPGETDSMNNPLCAAGTPAEGCPQKSTLQPSDWKLIMGNNPEGYDFAGADFHMVESIGPRTTNSGLWANAATCTPPAMGPPPLPGAAGADPINGCEFNTNNSDLQFACVFPLVDLDANNNIQSFVKDCTNPMYGGACDCTANSLDKASQLCSATTPTNQLYAKAYPSVREMIIANAMSNEQINGAVSNQGIVSSLCPIKEDVGESLTMAQQDPLFGYNPAVNAIIDRLKVSLTSSCETQKLVPALAADGGTTGAVDCIILVVLPAGTAGGTCTNPGAACDAAQGLSGPSSDPNAIFQQSLLNTFCMDHEMMGADPQITANQPVCALQQVIISPGDTETCASNNVGTGGATAPGWCYVQGAAATKLGCAEPNTIQFVAGSPPTGTTASLQCLEQAVNVTTAPDAAAGGD
jgi:hypothetical protein